MRHHDRRNDARRQEGKRDEQADVPFSLDVTLGDLGERADATKPEIEMKIRALI
jgi:hypothetical protein